MSQLAIADRWPPADLSTTGQPGDGASVGTGLPSLRLPALTIRPAVPATRPVGTLPSRPLPTTPPAPALEPDHDADRPTAHPAAQDADAEPAHADRHGGDHQPEAALPTPTEPSAAQPTRHRRSKAEKLRQVAADASRMRAYQTHPDVAALKIERVCSRVYTLIWTGLVLGLLFTMSNVAHFAAGNARAWSVSWLNAWLLDPMVSLVLIGTLIGCATIARYRIPATRWVQVGKWGTLASTYTMNTWSAWASLHPDQIVLHSVPPLIVFLAAELLTDLRNLLTQAVTVAYRMASERARRLAELDAAGHDPSLLPTDAASAAQPGRGQRKTKKAGRRAHAARPTADPAPDGQVPGPADPAPAPPADDTGDHEAVQEPDRDADQSPALRLAGGTDQDRLERMVSELAEVYPAGQRLPGRPTVKDEMKARGYTDGWTNSGFAGAALKELKQRRGEVTAG